MCEFISITHTLQEAALQFESELQEGEFTEFYSTKI